MTAVRVVEQHSELEGVGQVPHDEIDGAVTGSNFLITSGTVGANALSGSRVLTAGTGISFVDNGAGGTFVISATTTGSGQGRVRDYEVSVDQSVPNTGIRYLKSGNIFLSSVPLIMDKTIQLTGGSVRVNTSDTSNEYTAVIEVSGSGGFFDAETITLPVNENQAESLSFTTIVSQSFGIAVYLSRSAGSGRSDFDEIVFAFEGDEQ